MNDYIPLAIVHSMRRCMHVRRDDRLDLTMLKPSIRRINVIQPVFGSGTFELATYRSVWRESLD
jgi:hypothetical protein